MKIVKTIALSLTMASTHVVAFQAKVTATSDLTVQEAKTIEDNVISRFYRPHGIQYQLSPAATCAAVPAPGCNCSFCAALRSQNI